MMVNNDEREEGSQLTFNNSGGMNVKATQAAISNPQTTALMAIRCHMEGRAKDGDFAIMTGAGRDSFITSDLCLSGLS